MEQIKNPGACGTCVCGSEALVGLYQGALSRPGEKRQPQLRSAGVGKSVSGPCPVGGIGAPNRRYEGRNSHSGQKKWTLALHLSCRVSAISIFVSSAGIKAT